MNMNTITTEHLAGFETYLLAAERSEATSKKYLHEVSEFAAWLGGRGLSKEETAEWKRRLADSERAPATVNAALSALNTFLKYAGRADCRVKFLKIQRRAFLETARELTRKEYKRLLKTAYGRGQDRTGLVMETIASSGVRVSEVQYITVEAAERGQTEISLKGKIRTIVLPKALCKKLLDYAKTQKIASGEIFLGKNGRSLSRRQIWADMKALCKPAGVSATKVFPHNLRHLFAVVFYEAHKDIMRLADLMGHSSVNTTRIYLMTSGAEQRRMLDRLPLLI